MPGTLRVPSPSEPARVDRTGAPLSPGSARIEARKSMMVSAREFERVETLLGQDLQQRLKIEHNREIEVLWEEQIQLREELERIVDLMQSEVLPREKAMHDMLEKLEDAYKAATGNMQAMMGGTAKGGMQAHQREQVLGLRTPLEAMEKELERIDTLLGHDVVRPDIQGWQPSRPYAGRAAPASPTLGRPASSATRLGGYQVQMEQPGAPMQYQVGAPPQSAFDAIDRNHDGVISRQEFMQMQAAPTSLLGAGGGGLLRSTPSGGGGGTSSPRFAAATSSGTSSTPRTAGAVTSGYAGRYGNTSPSGGASPYAAGSLRSPYAAASSAPRSPYGGAGFAAGGAAPASRGERMY